MAKRKPTKKQLAALAKGRAARKAKRKVKRLTNKERRALGYKRERKTMAKKKSRRRSAPRRRRASPRRRRSGGGGRRGGIFAGIEYKDMLGAAAYGMAEKQVAEKRDEALLMKVPLFYEGIGYAGCLGIIAHFVGKNVGGAIGMAARHLAKGTLDVAAYKLAKRGKLYESKDSAVEALAGEGDDDMGWEPDDEVGIELEGDEEMGYGADGIAGDDDD